MGKQANASCHDATTIPAYQSRDSGAHDADAAHHALPAPLHGRISRYEKHSVVAIDDRQGPPQLQLDISRSQVSPDQFRACSSLLSRHPSYSVPMSVPEGFKDPTSCLVAESDPHIEDASCIGSCIETRCQLCIRFHNMQWESWNRNLGSVGIPVQRRKPPGRQGSDSLRLISGSEWGQGPEILG